MKRRPLVPGRPSGPLPVVLAALFAAAAALAIASLHGLSGSLTGVFVGLSLGSGVVLAVAVRARRSFCVLEAAYLDLDQALFRSEQACDRLSVENEELAGANVGLRAAQIAFAELLNLANERSNGQMRTLVEETGEGLAEILAEQLSFAQRVHD